MDHFDYTTHGRHAINMRVRRQALAWQIAQAAQKPAPRLVRDTRPLPSSFGVAAWIFRKAREHFGKWLSS